MTTTPRTPLESARNAGEFYFHLKNELGFGDLTMDGRFNMQIISYIWTFRARREQFTQTWNASIENLEKTRSLQALAKDVARRMRERVHNLEASRNPKP